MKIKLRLYIQSQSDIITNSSSEIFCMIESKQSIHEIEEYLNSLFEPYGARCRAWDEPNEPDLIPNIQFSISWGEDTEKVTDPFIALLDEVLSNKFGKDTYKLITDDLN